MFALHDFWQDRRVFVTGATGLVGGWTVQALLERGAHVVALVRDRIPGCELVASGLIDRVDAVSGAVEDYPLVERILGEYEIQTVLHLAAQTIVGIATRTPLSTFESNIKGTWCVLEAARRCGRPHVVVASSDKAYGEHATLPYVEDTPLAARHPYDASKACADLLAQTYAHTYDLPVCVTRCGNFYGGGDLNWNRLVPGTIRAFLRGQNPVIRSDGSCVRDYLYVKDGAAAYLHLAERMAHDPEISGQAFNFSTETPKSVLEMVRCLQELLGSALTPDIRNEATNEIQNQSLCAGKARLRLGWRPQYTLAQGLAETIDWYRNYFASAADSTCFGYAA